jgi:hypothetical protein
MSPFGPDRFGAGWYGTVPESNMCTLVEISGLVQVYGGSKGLAYLPDIASHHTTHTTHTTNTALIAVMMKEEMGHDINNFN